MEKVAQSGPPVGGGKIAKEDKLSSFAADTASRTNVDVRTVRRDATRGERIPEQVLAEVRGHP